MCNVDDVEKATKLLAQTTLRNMLGTRTLAGILSEREVSKGIVICVNGDELLTPPRPG